MMDLEANNTGSVADLLGGAAPGVDAGAGAGGGADAGAGAGSAENGGPTPEWYGALSVDVGEGETASNHDYVKAKGFKDLDGLVKAYRHAEKGLHESGRVKVPGEGASEAEIAEYRAAIGVPEKPEDYARPEFKDASGNVVPYNTELTDRIFVRAHELGVPKTVAEQLVAGEIAKQIEEFDANIAQQQQQANAHVQSWGADKDAKLAQVNAALKELDFTRQDVEYLRGMPSGVGKFLDAMAKVGTNFTEDTLIKGDRQQFGMNPADAKKELDTMKTDPVLSKKITIPGTAERQRYERLLNIVAKAAA
jgi:hypothetical protein